MSINGNSPGREIDFTPPIDMKIGTLPAEGPAWNGAPEKK
jgi:hypothetical protein